MTKLIQRMRQTYQSWISIGAIQLGRVCDLCVNQFRSREWSTSRSRNCPIRRALADLPYKALPKPISTLGMSSNGA